MTKDELKMLHAYINSSIHYLEFGSGQSTIYASGVPTIKSIDSVESSEQYISEFLKPDTMISNALSSGKLSFHIMDIGKTKIWGYPQNQSRRHLWPNYSQQIFSRPSNHDLVLVDGRFRVACILNCILNTRENCTILVHDFWDRPKYHIVLNYLETIDKVDTFGVFCAKKDIDSRKIESLIKKYQYLPGV